MEEKKTTYKTILANREYRKLLFSNAINRFGDSVDSIAFTWLVYRITHDAMWSAIVFALNMLPNVIVQPFAGAIVEKMNKKAVIVLTHSLRAAVIAGFALMYRFDLVTAPVMAVATVLVTTLESFNLPASSAYTAYVLKKEDMTVGISLDRTLSGTAKLAGTGIAGVIIEALGIPAAMLIDVLTFVIATLLIAFMITPGKTVRVCGEEGKAAVKEKFSKILAEGVRYVVKTPAVRNFCLICIALNFMLVPINALLAPIAEEIFGMGSGLLSIAGVFGSIGSIVGASLLPVIVKKLSPLKITCISIGALGIGMASVTLGRFCAGREVACYVTISACFFVMTLSASVMGNTIEIQFMKLVDREYMARASAVFNSSSTAAMPVGSLLVSMAVSHVPTYVIILISASFAGIVLLVTALTRPVLEKKEELQNAA